MTDQKCPTTSRSDFRQDTMTRIEAFIRSHDEENGQLYACNSEVFDKGAVVFTTHTIPSHGIEWWVCEVARESGQPVDWNFQGGRAVVRALGDLDRVLAAIKKLKPIHDEMMAIEMEKLGIGSKQD